MDFSHMTAPCGLPCFECYALLANENAHIRQMVSKELNIPLERATCAGCRNEKGKCAVLPMPCSVYRARRKRALNIAATVQIFRAIAFIPMLTMPNFSITQKSSTFVS